MRIIKQGIYLCNLTLNLHWLNTLNFCTKRKFGVYKKNGKRLNTLKALSFHTKLKIYCT